MVNSGAREQLFFEAPSGKRVAPAKRELEQMAWTTWSGVLGREVEGVWPPKSDITDINGVHRSRDARLVATADDFGTVKIFSYPATVSPPHPPSRTYTFTYILINSK